MPAANERIQFVDDPYGSGPIAVVPPIKPDVAILHAQRADEAGNAVVGFPVCSEVAFSNTSSLSLKNWSMKQLSPQRPQPHFDSRLVVDAVVVEPYGAHPSYVQGYYDRDNVDYLAWDTISRDEATTAAWWLDEWVCGVADRAAYLAKLGQRADRPARARRFVGRTGQLWPLCLNRITVDVHNRQIQPVREASQHAPVARGTGQRATRFA